MTTATAQPIQEYHQEPGETSRFIVGVDLGQSIDSTAIAVLHHKITREGRKPRLGKVARYDSYALRHLERIPLGTSYVQQAHRIGTLMQTAPIRGSGTLVIDQTGVGRPVLDIFRDHGLRPVGVTITGGAEEKRTSDGFGVPKLQLVSRLQAMLHNGDLRIAGGLPEADALKGELADFRVSYTQGSGHARFGAREGRHDDLVLSVSLAVWYAARPQGSVGVGKVYGLM